MINRPSNRIYRKVVRTSVTSRHATTKVTISRHRLKRSSSTVTIDDREKPAIDTDRKMMPSFRMLIPDMR